MPVIDVQGVLITGISAATTAGVTAAINAIVKSRNQTKVHEAAQTAALLALISVVEDVIPTMSDQVSAARLRDVAVQARTALA